MPTGTDLAGTKHVKQELVIGKRALLDANGVPILVDGSPITEDVALGCQTTIVHAQDQEDVKVTPSGQTVGALPGCPDSVTVEYGRVSATAAIEAAGKVVTEARDDIGTNVEAIGSGVGNIIKEATGLVK